jgi:alpha-L-rhamnosidase
MLKSDQHINACERRDFFMIDQALWIWGSDEKQPINEQACFRRTFELSGEHIQSAEITISADSRYRLWVNGQSVGSGPIRSTAEHWFYDRYEITHLLRAGHNTVAVQVWHFGHSNYQYIEAAAGLIASVHLIEGESFRTIVSDSTWKHLRHPAYDRITVKRNVNLGWMEIYDANKELGEWTLPDYDDSFWQASVVAARYGEEPWGQLHPRPIYPLVSEIVQAKRIVEVAEVQPVQVLSLQLRDNFFPGERDANAKVFSGFVAACLEAPQGANGKLTFAHTPWNGVQGRFRVGGDWKKSGDLLELTPGKHLFLLEIYAVHNDAFAHMELDFDREIRFISPFEQAEAAFYTLGPIERKYPNADGVQPVYGGVEKRTGLDREHPLLLLIGAISSLQELQKYHKAFMAVAPEHVIPGKHIYSLARSKQVLGRYPVTRDLEHLLFGYGAPAMLPEPTQGGDMELTIDFGSIVVGEIEFEIDVPRDTVIDVYGFEFRNERDNFYTSGCNNAYRYIARQGRQRFRSGTRMGFRYIIVAFRKLTAPARIYSIQMEQSFYPAAGHGAFRCSDPLLNDIWDISHRTMRLCMEDTFVDCPTYEQVYWVGDCRVSALIDYRMFGSYELIKHCLTLVPKTRKLSRLLPACLPTDWQTAIPMWTFSWIAACAEYVRHSGDQAIIAELLPEIIETLDVYRSFLNEDGLLDMSAWNLLDWAPIDMPYTGVSTAGQALLAHCHELSAEMAAVLGKEDTAEALRGYAKSIKSALWSKLWDPSTSEFIDGIHRTGELSTTRSVQTHVLLYLTDCLTEEQRAIIEPLLTAPPEHWVKVGTPFFSFYLFEAWKKMGQTGRIVEAIRRDWGRMLDYGATTTWETFETFPRSHAHAWSAAPGYFLSDLLLGVECMTDGYDKIKLKPPETELVWAEGIIPTPRGRLEASWSKREGKAMMRALIPAGIEVEVDSDSESHWDIQWEYV